jgi:hypothetical protein
MQQVKLPTDVLDLIREAGSEVQVVDEGGEIKGYLISPEYRSLMYAWLKSQFDDDDEELREARSETGGYTTAEAIAYLRELEARHRVGS